MVLVQIPADSESSSDSDSGTDPRTEADTLFQAIRDGDLTTLDGLVQQDPSVLQLKDESGHPLMCVAARHGQLGVVDYLADQDVPLDQAGWYGRTPLMRAAWRGHGDVVARLVTLSASLTMEDDYGWTALHWAVRGEDPGTAPLSKLAKRGNLMTCR